MSTQFINPDGMMKSPAFSQAVITQGVGKTIYIGGQNAVDENGKPVGKYDIAKQTEQIMKNIGLALEAAGANYKDIIKLNVYAMDGVDIRKGFEAASKFIGDNPSPPIVTAIFVARLGSPDYLVEVEAVAFVPD